MLLADGQFYWLMVNFIGWWSLLLADGQCYWLMVIVIGWWSILLADGHCYWRMVNIIGWWPLLLADGQCYWLTVIVIGRLSILLADGQCYWLMFPGGRVQGWIQVATIYLQCGLWTWGHSRGHPRTQWHQKVTTNKNNKFLKRSTCISRNVQG